MDHSLESRSARYTKQETNRRTGCPLTESSSLSPRTYLYKLTSDRGGAPCAPPPRGTHHPLLTLSICKPAIRRTAQPGDRILGITSRALVDREGYPANSIIYAAIVTGAVAAREYYAARSPFRSRPDCIYRFHRENGMITHAGSGPLHEDEAYRSRDIGQYPFYRNGRALLSTDFRYFGRHAATLPTSLWRLEAISSALGQGHRVFTEKDPETPEVITLFRLLWYQSTFYTPALVLDESYDHTLKTKTAKIPSSP